MEGSPKSVTNFDAAAINNATKVASTGIQTAGQSVQGAVGSVTGAASNVLTPLARGIWGGVQALGSGIGGRRAGPWGGRRGIHGVPADCDPSELAWIFVFGERVDKKRWRRVFGSRCKTTPSQLIRKNKFLF